MENAVKVNDSNNSTRLVLQLISRITGHPVESLSEDSFLQADLGIDSIKLVELLNGILSLLPEEIRRNLGREVLLQYLVELQTVGDLIESVREWQEGRTGDQDGPEAAPLGSRSAELMSQPSIEVLHSQYPFLIGHWAVSTCSLASRVRVHGMFNVDTARAAWKDLIERHVALRLRFDIPRGTTSFLQYQMVLASDTTAPVIEMTDLRRMLPAAQEEVLSEETNQAIRRTWDLEIWPLHEIVVYRLADDVFEVMICNHHLISDGLSNQMLVREFLELYRARASRSPARLPPPVTLEQYRKLVSEINSWNSEQEGKALDEYLKKQNKGRFFFNPSGVKLTATRAVPASRRYRLSREVTAALVQRSRERRITLNSLLVGAYGRALCRLDDRLKSIIINVPTSGRVYPGVEAFDIVGCFAQNLALTFQIWGDEPWDDLLSRVHHEIENAITSGFDRAQTRRLGVTAREGLVLQDGRMTETTATIVRAGMKTSLYLSFAGQTHIEEQYGPLSVIDYQAATTTNAGAIDNLVELIHGQIQITSNYDTSLFDEKFIDELIGELFSQVTNLASEIKEVVRPLVASPRSRDMPHISRLVGIVQGITRQHVSSSEIDKDLEADFGLDSLERIRVVNEIYRAVGSGDRQRLVACRTIREMAEALVSVTDKERKELASPQDSEVPYLLFIEQASINPDAIAIDYGETSLRYGDLHRLSNRLANELRTRGVQPGHLVGIATRPGPSMLIGMLGILKAGAAYIPLDPDYPVDRLHYMVGHSEIRTLLVEQHMVGELVPALDPHRRLESIIVLDKPAPAAVCDGRPVIGLETWIAASDQDLPQRSHADDRMVILYTSGSTGRPKGVVLNHRGYMNRLRWMQKTFPLAPGVRVAQKTSCCFDISVWELFWPLMYGATVCVVDRAVVKNPWSLAQWMERTHIHVMHFVPSLFGEFVHSIAGGTFKFADLRWLIFSGEALPPSVIQEWMNHFGMRVGLANLYGPTEASIDVTAHIITGKPKDLRIPIGQPIDNCNVMVLDEEMRPCPQGTMGELWLGGVQLATGYLNNPEMTQRSFVPNPFPHVVGPHLYRTGDLAVELPDGSFDYRGRCDTQVKIRGFRIELGEIESTLNSHPAIEESAVLVADHGDGQVRLIAFVAGQHQEAKGNALRDYVKQKLPDYMVPHRIEWLDRLPKNQNGKLDRSALKSRLEAGHEVKRPSSPPPAGKVEAAHEAKRPSVPLPAGKAAASTPVSVPPPAPVMEHASMHLRNGTEEELPLGPAQRWLVSYFERPYNWCGYTRFRYNQPLDVPLFNLALQKLTKRHSALRTIFARQNEAWIQLILGTHPPIECGYQDGSHLDDAARDREMRAFIERTVESSRVDSWPLWRTHVIKRSDTSYDITVVGHHMMSDMISNTIVFKDLWRIYGELLADPTSYEGGGGPVPSSYADFVRSIEGERASGGLDAHVQYYTSQFPSRERRFEIPVDKAQGANVEASAAIERIAVPSGLTLAVLDRARASYRCSFYVLLLAALYRGMSELTGRDRVVLSHRTHGRDLGNGQAFFETAGNFAVNFPLAIMVKASESWQDVITHVSSAFSQLPMNGITYDAISDRLPADIYPDDKLTSVRVNYLGNRTQPRSRLFDFDTADRDQRYAPPNQRRPSLLEVFISTSDGALVIELGYSKNIHRVETVRSVGEKFVALLTEVAAKAPEPARVRSAQGTSSSVKATEPAFFRGTRSSASSSNGAGPSASGVLVPGKVAIVTGGGRGIGRSTALALARHGGRVAVVSRTREQVDETVRMVEALGTEALGIVADVSNLSQVESAVNAVVARFGGIDILVNNAGVTSMGSVAKSDPAEWRRIFEVNLFGAYNFSRSSVPHLLARGGGKIINVGSDSSMIGYPLFSAYAASKHAIIGLTKSLAEELKQSNVQVNAVCPAFVDTDMAPKAVRQKAIPTEKVADTILFLASSLSDSITGESLCVFGTQDMYWYGSRTAIAAESMSSVKR